MLSDYGEHTATVTVELANGTSITQVQKFSSGNPRYLAGEAQQATDYAAGKVVTAIRSIYGDIRNDKS
jgi:hypothetical protein